MSYDLIAKIQTTSDLTPWRMGKRLLTGVFSSTKLTPERIATFSEVTARNGHDVAGIEACERYWATTGSMRSGGVSRDFTADFYWKRTKVAKSLGGVTFSSVDIKGNKIPGRLLFQAQFRKDVDWLSLFKAWCETSQAYAGILHPFVSKDGLGKSSRDVRDYSFEESVQSQAWSRFLGGELHCEFRAGDLNSLVSGFTNLGWATYFGGEYAHEVDFTAISAAGFPVQEIEGGYLVQVTEDINDAVSDFAMFSKRRSALKSLFRDDMFLIKDEPRVP